MHVKLRFTTLAANSLRIPCGGRPGLRRGLVLHGLAGCEDLAVNAAQALDPFHLDLDRYRHMYRDDLEVCHLYTDIIYSLVTGVAWYIVVSVLQLEVDWLPRASELVFLLRTFAMIIMISK